MVVLIGICSIILLINKYSSTLLTLNYSIFNTGKTLRIKKKKNGIMKLSLLNDIKTNDVCPRVLGVDQYKVSSSIITKLKKKKT